MSITLARLCFGVNPLMFLAAALRMGRFLAAYAGIFGATGTGNRFTVCSFRLHGQPHA